MTTNDVLILILLILPLVIIEQIIQRRQDAKIKDNSILLSNLANLEKELIYRGYNEPGIYIFTNLNNKSKYVGQSINPIDRINNHTKGRGNPDIYNDIQKGVKFSIEILKLKDTRFSNLNDLERHYISKYNTYHNGYNRTRGNRTA